MGLCLDLHNEWQLDTIGLTVIRLIGLCSWETMRLAIPHEVIFSAIYRTTFVVSAVCSVECRMTLCSGTKLVCVDVAVKGGPCCFASRSAILRRPFRSRFGSSQLLGLTFAMLRAEALKCTVHRRYIIFRFARQGLASRSRYP